MASPAKYAGVFVVVVALVVGVSAVAPAFLGGAAPPGVQPENASTFDPDAILAEDFDERGNVSVDGNQSGKVVVIDAAHANSFSRGDIQPLVDALVESGHEVRFHGAGQQAGSGFGSPGAEQTLNASLQRADALVVISPGTRYRAGEINGVRNFTDRGGRVLMLAEPESVSISLGGGGGPAGLSIQRIQSQLTPLASAYGMDVGTDYLFNMDENANNFQYVYATPTDVGPLTEGVDRVALPQSTRLTVDEDDASTALTATEGTQLQSTRSTGTYAVAARNGNVTAIADSTFLGPDFHRVADNEVLLGNVAEFLTSGEKEPKPTSSRETGAGPGRPGPGPGPGGPAPPRPTPPSP